MKKRVFALLLALVMVIGMLPATAMAANNFTKSESWDDGLFTDVKQADWFYENVKSAYELGLMLGCGDGTFEPYGRITLAQTVAVAARLHAVATTGKDNFVQGDPWYRVYVDYALANGILDKELADYNQEATRLEFAHILVRAMPAEDLQAINDIKYGEIPDVADDEAVYTLYRAGILNGKGNGQFGANDIIDRSQMAAIVTRMALPELRQKVEKESGIPSTGGNLWWPDFGVDDDVQPSPSPAPEEAVKVTVAVESENGAVKNAVSMEGEDGVKATVPAGVTLTEGAKELTLTVDAMESTGSDVTAGEDEAMTSYDVHIEGVAADNTVVITVAMGAILPKGLNMGNVELYHVEDGTTNAMKQVLTLSELDEHNEFYYDPATGEVTVALVSFSEITFVAGHAKWEGKRDYSWYNASKTELNIANADQLAGFSAIVGGMDGQTQDSFEGKTVKLICDIDIGDLDSENGIVFYPIGYYNTDGTYEKTNKAITSGFKTFEGTFDGNGHTIANFYQNTWEMKGDHNWYDANLQYYRDGMGLFGKVYGGTVKNLTVKNFSSDGEITTTGTIAAYADCGATFENIAIFNCNPRVYNIGNGGIVGCVGWYANDADRNEVVTFRNITVDNTNKISALWGSWDVACGGLVGQYYPTSGQSNAIDNAGIHMENCHVAAQIDVYNDVCANYQYYAYRYAGILIGSVRENVTVDGHVYPDMDGITASGCTVHFGDWNDYYYCELVANSLASYTHDHQMSRLEQVAAVNGTTITPLEGEAFTVPAEGRYNYVVVKDKDDKGMWIHGDGADYATCYHFVNGAVWDHATEGTEEVDTNGDGVKETVLKEDKQLIYREFNNLVTGYGWGVTSKGIGEMNGVTILDREEGDSVTKFTGKGVAEVETSTVIKIGDLFAYVDGAAEELNADSLMVSVTDLDNTDGVVTGEFVRNETNWAEGTLTLSGKGRIAITIQDYHYCTPTTIEINSIDPIDSFIVYATTLYEVGQAFNVNRAVVGYKYGADKNLAVGEYTVNTNNFTTAGVQTVTVSYTELGHTVTYDVVVEVVDAFNGLIASSKKTTYEVGTELTIDDFYVTCVTSQGAAHGGEITGYEISAVDTSTSGKKIVTISFENPTTHKVLSTTCEVLIFKLQNISDEVVQYWFFDGNFNVSGWSHLVYNNCGAGYLTYVGQTYTAPNGEIVTGFDGSWADPATTPNDGATGAGHTAHMSAGRYDLVINDALPYTTLGINCIAGYSEPLLGFGYYVDGDLSTLQFTAPAIIYDETNDSAPDANNLTLLDYLGTNNGHAVVEMNCNKFAPGSTHTVYWVAVFADGVKNISEWKVNMKVAEQSDAAFVDTEKPNVNVIVMAGQSNMFGASPITQVIRDKYENFNFSNVYIHYNNINFNVNADGTVANTMQTFFSNNGFQKYQLGIGGQANTYFGPETALAYYLATAEEFKNDQWYIIKYAAAGTGLAAQWMSACTVNGQTTTLTDDMLAYVQEAIAGLEAQNFDVQIHSFMWMQGETDALDKTWAENYAANEKILVSRVRNAFAGNATRYAGDLTVPGGGMAFINAGIAINDTDNNTANGGPNDWVWAEIVNAGKVSNSQQLCSVPGHNAATNGLVLQTGPVAGNKFVIDVEGVEVAVPTIVNPNRENAIVNSIFLDTHHLLSKLNSTDEHSEYTGGDATDWAHYGAVSMNVLGELFASGNHYMMITGPIESAAKKYTVTYNANGGSVTPGSATVNAGEAVTLPTPDARAGYTFNGWYTEATGGTKVGDVGASYMPTANVTLYAQWERITYTVTYNANGGSVTPGSATVNAGEVVTLPTPTREGYSFNGWSDGTTTYAAGASYTPSANVTLTAQWERITYTVTYNANGGSVSSASATVNAGETVALPTPDARTGYTFNGWYTEATGGTKIGDAGASYMPTANVTLYAQWSRSCVTPDTLVTMADGSQKRIDEVTYEDELLVWDFRTGEFVTTAASVLVNHGYGDYEVITLNFDDSTVVKVVGEHGFFNADQNEFVFINSTNVETFVGNSFVKHNGETYSTVKLIGYSVAEEYTGSYSILSNGQYNCLLEGLFSLTPPIVGKNFLMPFEIGEGMKYDEIAMQADIEKYGLYTYEEFADYLTYEQFVALDVPYLKVAVGKGLITVDEYLALVCPYLPD